jgi:hypothetical protein
VPTTGGLPIGGTIFGGTGGGKLAGPISNVWVSLSDLGAGDTSVWVGQGDANGKFTIPHVPDGAYTVTWWDEDQNYILDLVNVTVVNGETVDMGVLPLTGWWTNYDGYVFNDLNRNGVMDWNDLNHDGCPQPGEGELGIPNYTLSLRRRDNSLMDRGSNLVGTDACGHYVFESGYPMTQWLVMEAYNDLYYGTGVTYQADNQPTPTTVLGAGVDVSTLPIIGLSGRMDWGVHAYDARGTNGVDPRNGGIVGTVSYDTTRNELDPRYAAVEDWQPGVSGLTVELYTPVDCTDPISVGGTQVCDPDEIYVLGPDGEYLKSPDHLVNTYVTETWAQPGADLNGDGIPNDNGDGNCVPRDVDGNPVAQQITANATDCLEAPLMGVQFQQGFSTVDGNYGFGDGCFTVDANGDPTGLTFDGSDPANPTCTDATGADAFAPLLGASDYLVHVVDPVDAVHGRPLYQFTREEDINIGNGDEFVTPQVPPPACVGALHQVDVAGAGNDGYAAKYYKVDLNTGTLVLQDPTVDGELPNADTVQTIPASTATVNPTFLDLTPPGSPYEGQATPLCDTKLVPLANGRSIVPTFNVFTDVPLPGRFWGLVVDDLNFSSDPHQINYGEKAGVGFAPVGIYDNSNRLVYTTESDYSGLFDVLMPSTNRINCPTPSGVCAGVYRFVGNDPGVPGNLNENYRPEFRTIAADFEAMPGLVIPADLAPTQVGVTVQLPGGQTVQVQCAQAPSAPQFYAVDRPFVRGAGSFTIKGASFGATPGTIKLGTTTIAPANVTWGDTSITVNVPAGFATGAYQLTVTTSTGLTPVNSLTFHVLPPSRTDNANTFDGRTVIDPLIRAADVGSFVSGAGIPPLTTITSVDTSGPASTHSFTISRTATQTAVTNVTITIAVLPSFHGVTVALGSNTALDSQIAASDVGRSVSFSPTAGLSGTRTITSVNPGVSFVFSGLPRLSGGFLNTTTRLATITTPPVTHSALVNNGTFVIDAATVAGDVGASVSGSGIPAGTTVAQSPITYTLSGTTYRGFRMNNAASATSYPATVTLTIQAGAAGYNPNLYEVGPGHPYSTIQSAVDAAEASTGDDLVVVYPNTAEVRTNPRGAYYENLILTKGIKLQGIGSGSPSGSVPGSIIDGGAFAGDGGVFDAWYAKIDSLFVTDANGNDVPGWQGNANINDGAVISIYTRDGQFGSTFKASIDGFDLRGGDQQGFPANLNQTGGTLTGLPANLVTQGGAIFANAYARNLQITNNVVQNNGGGYGTIRIGTPDLNNDPNHNENVRIANNRIIANAGTNLAGGIGLYEGSDGYEVANNDICGNFSAEYGGGVTAYGYSPGGSIHHNRIWFNRSYDEGGGIMIAGALAADPFALYGTPTGPQGTGAVSIHDNVIQSNLSNDDGGGLRFLMAGNFPMTVFNNTIVNNVSTHEGGGVGINDTPDIRFFNNTVMKNITTATALTSNGLPAPAGLATSVNSDALQGTLPGGSPAFSNPLLFNNIFSDNRAGTRLLDRVSGLGANGPSDVTVWDLGVADGTGVLAPTNSVVSQNAGIYPYTASATNSAADPLVIAPYDTVVTFNGWRTNPNFLGAILVSLDLPPELLGDYHLSSGSPAIDLGAVSKAGTAAATTDIDGQARPAGGGYDAGSDEVPGPAPVGFPANGILDNFNRANAGNLGPNWSKPSSGYRVNTSTLELRGNTAGPELWTASLFGPAQEAYLTFTDISTLATRQGVVLKSSATGEIRVSYERSSSTAVVELVSANVVSAAGSVPMTLANGDTFGAGVTATGDVTVYRNGTAVGGTIATGLGGGGYIGVTAVGTTNTSAGNARIDNFGGGTRP